MAPLATIQVYMVKTATVDAELRCHGPESARCERMRPMFPPALIATAESLLATLRARKLMIAAAESCTGGLIAGVLTEIAGSSDVVERGFVTYSNEAKNELIGVPMALIKEHGAVSRHTPPVAYGSGAARGRHPDGRGGGRDRIRRRGGAAGGRAWA